LEVLQKVGNFGTFKNPCIKTGKELTENQYILSTVTKHTSNSTESLPVFRTALRLHPVIRQWAGFYLLKIVPTGSYAKKTAIKGFTDIDLFISLSSKTPATLSEIYGSLSEYIKKVGYPVREQNVSIGIELSNFKIDLVPAKRQAESLWDHSIYRRKAKTWIKTNVNRHIAFVKNSGRLNEIRAIKIWRNLNSLEFPSFYLELSVINALKGCMPFRLASNIIKVFEYLSDDFLDARIEDPANSNNIVSDDLTREERTKVAKAAYSSLKERYWEHIIW
jgi:hypothetical protein